MTSIFLSYARADDGEPYDPETSFVARLHRDLTAAGFDVWFDQVSMPSRPMGFELEIMDALRARERVIYVGGPRAAVSDYVREEWRFALECDKTVIPILRWGDFDTVPGELSGLHCEDFRDDTLYAAQIGKLVANLNLPDPPLGHLFGVPSLPAHFLGRPDLLRRVRDAVRVALQKPVVITSATSRVGLQGMGGIGKSVLAAAVARDREIRRSYPDGVIWVSFGQIKDSEAQMVVAQLMRDVARHLGDPGLFDNVVQGQGVLRELLLTKAVLLVCDDVWHASDVQPFDVLGPRCRALITTRDAGIIHTLQGQNYPVELFTEAEALSLLASAVEKTPDEMPAEARDVVKECAGLPLALALCAGMAKKRGGEWGSILERLRRADLEKIEDREAINQQHRSIYRAMQASVEWLQPEEQRRFAELSVFVTDQDVPEAAIATLWAHTGHLNALDTEDLLINLSERALIRLEQMGAKDGSSRRRRMSLHDLLYDFARRVAGDRKGLTQALLDAYRRQCPGEWHTGPDDGYFFRNLCQHLVTAKGNWDAPAELLSDLRFVEARCRVGQVFELLADYHLALDNLPEAQEGLRERRAQEQRATRWTADITRYARAWSERRDRVARGEPVEDAPPELPDIPEACTRWTDEALAAESRRIVEQPTRLDRFSAFAGFVRRECYPLAQFGRRAGFVAQHAWNDAPTGPVPAAATKRLADGLAPVLLRCWPEGAVSNPLPALLATLEGHTGGVDSVSVTPDGRRAVSGSRDTTVRVWDLERGVCVHSLEGHGERVNSVSVTPDGRRAVSGSWDTTVRSGTWSAECVSSRSTPVRPSA